MSGQNAGQRKGELAKASREAYLARLRHNRTLSADELLAQHEKAARFVLELERAKKGPRP